MRHMSIIDEALARARGVVQGSTKSASAPTQTDLVKEAEDLAGALEYISLATVDDGTAAGTAAAGVLSNFFKGAAKGGQGPAESVASGGGTQSQVPASGKTHIPVGTPGGTSPGESVAPTGSLSRDAMAQPPAKSASAPTLYDLIAGGLDANEKSAALAGQGPSESVGGQNSAAPPAKNENTNIGLLRSNEAPVSATKRSAKLPTRARLKQLWAGASDTSSDASAKAVWPQAASKGSIKVAKDRSESSGLSEKDRSAFVGAGAGRGAVRGALTGGLHGAGTGATLGGVAGGVAGFASGHGLKNRLMRGAGGAGIGGIGGMGLGGVAGGALGTPAGAVAGSVSGSRSADKGFTEDLKKDRAIEKAEKKGSVAEWSQAFDALLDGAAGEEAQAFAQHIDEYSV